MSCWWFQTKVEDAVKVINDLEWNRFLIRFNHWRWVYTNNNKIQKLFWWYSLCIVIFLVHLPSKLVLPSERNIENIFKTTSGLYYYYSYNGYTRGHKPFSCLTMSLFATVSEANYFISITVRLKRDIKGPFKKHSKL